MEKKIEEEVHEIKVILIGLIQVLREEISQNRQMIKLLEDIKNGNAKRH